MACAQTRVPTSAPASAASPPSADPRKPTSRSSPPCSPPSGTSATPEPSTTTPVQITSPASTPNEPRLGHSTNSKPWATASLSTAPTDAKDPSSHQKSSATLFPISVPYSAWLARLRLILSPKLQGESGRPGLGSSRPRLRTPASAGHSAQSSSGRDSGDGAVTEVCGHGVVAMDGVNVVKPSEYSGGKESGGRDPEAA